MKLGSLLSGVILALPALLAALWGALFLRFQMPGGEMVATIAAAVYALATLIAVGLLFTRRRWWVTAGLALPTVILFGWFSALEPRNDRDWVPELARLPSGTVEGDILTVSNVRHFNWVSLTEADPPRWETRSYDLGRLSHVDLFMSYWAGPAIAHTIISFEFDDGRFLAWSIEVRYREGQSFSAVAGFFRTAEIAFVAADERDVIRRRTDITREDVYLYRLAMRPERAREFLLSYVEDANALARRPKFYNSLTSNCTTVILRMARAIGIELPFDWRLIANGYLPDFLYDRGALYQGLPFAELRAASAVSERGRAIGDSRDFSGRLREGLPGF